MDHSCSSSGQPAGPERPPAPGPARTAVNLMYAGAAVSTVQPSPLPQKAPTCSCSPAAATAPASGPGSLGPATARPEK